MPAKTKAQASKSPSTIKVLIFGDVVGKLGRRVIQTVLPEWQKKFSPDLVVANVENLAHGKGVTEKTLTELVDAGVQLFTGGNHIWAKSDPMSAEIIDHFKLAVPANDSRATTKTPWAQTKLGSVEPVAISLQGQVFMADEVENPFHTFDALYKKLASSKIILVDLHAEATSEKIALGFYCDGRASVVYGTHTHVPTKDARILASGTGYITDIGMTGSDDSVIGVAKETILKRFVDAEKVVFDYPETGAAIANTLYCEIDTATGNCVAIEHIQKKVIME